MRGAIFKNESNIGLVHVDVNEFFVLRSVCHTRGHVYKLYKTYSSDIRSSFCDRIINVWNSLPADVNFSTVNTFKNSIDRVILPSFLDGVCNLCVCFFSFQAAVRAFSLAFPADYCLVTHCIYCHSWRINVNVNMNVSKTRQRHRDAGRAN